MKKAFFLLGVFTLLLFYGSDAAASRIREYFEKGEKAYSEGNYKQAVQYYEQVVEISPDFAPVYNALGLAHLRMNARLSDIVWFFKEASALDPQYASPHNNLCKIYYQIGAYSQAEEACLKTVSLDSSFGNAPLFLAWIYLARKSQPGTAVYYFNKVLEKVKTPKIYFGLGLAYSLKGHHAEVLDIVTILRGMEENELAAQLESTLRPDGNPEVFTEFIRLPKGKPGKLIPAGPAPVKETVPQESGGLMRVRLRGKLTNEGGGDSPAIDRIRAMQATGRAGP